MLVKNWMSAPVVSIADNDSMMRAMSSVYIQLMKAFRKVTAMYLLGPIGLIENS